MTRAILALAAGLLLGFADLSVAQDDPVVVELYTSQGCSSCPPADELLAELAKRDDVIALALHVDYWDYIGWKDSFAVPAFTQRQKGYARAAGHRTIYTPQMVIGGADHVVGFRPMEVADLIQSHRQTPVSARLALTRDGGWVSVSVEPAGANAGPMVVQLVRYRPMESVEIMRGENAGQTISYANVVTQWQKIGDWDGTEPLVLRVEISGNEPVAVIVQKPRQGPIVAAAVLR